MIKRVNILYKILLVSSVIGLCSVEQAFAQRVIKGKVLSSYNNAAVANAIVSIKNSATSAQTNKNGDFSLKVDDVGTSALITVWSPGFHELQVSTLKRDSIVVTLVPDTRFKFDEVKEGIFANKGTSILYNQDFKDGVYNIEDVIAGEFSGLNVINKSGMPTEGSVLNFRGIRTLTADNSPLIILNGMPYFPDNETSTIIGGYSRSVFNAINPQDVKSIRLLKGSEAAVYGSLASNGVLLIETSSADDLETVIEFKGNYGIGYNNKRIPVLQGSDFKNFIGDVGMSQFADMNDMISYFPFLRDDPNYYYNFLYNNHTDWQNEIYTPAFVTDNHLRIKGGDAIAKYDLSLGVMDQNGTLDNSKSTRYSTRLNSTLTLGKKFDLSASVALTYATNKLHEQGMLQATNPMLASLYQAPILSPYRKDDRNNILPDYDIVRQFNVSNPLALLNTTTINSDIYDVFVNAGVKYKATQNINVYGTFGLFSSYNRQSTFIPGLSSRTILPLENGVALNSARSGSGKNSNIYYKINADYTKQLDESNIQAGVGFQGMITDREYDAGFGRNTSSDFYRTLNYVNAAGRAFDGYNESWNWMSFYGFVQYDWRNLVKASTYLSTDGASSTGVDVNRFGFYPGVDLSFLLSNTSAFKDIANLDLLTLNAGYSKTANSRYSSKLSQAYYSSQIYRQLSGIVVGNIPNTSLNREDVRNWDVSLIASLWKKRLNLSASYYHTTAKDVVQAVPVTPIAGIENMYVNGATLLNTGFEFDANLTLIEKKDFGFTIGGNLSTLRNEVKSLNNIDQKITTAPYGMTLITQVGGSPYDFYGYQFNGVISNSAEASRLNLTDFKNLPFEAGDAIFEDINKDGIIDKDDRKSLGNALPKFYGSGFVDIRFKKLTLRGYVTFSKGNKMYNAVRRSLEDMSSYKNQSTAILNRWQEEGQMTTIPKATYGDPMGNSRFSDRWIEDASYLRLSNVVLKYNFGAQKFKLLNNTEIYISGENIYTWTKYLGLDPVTAYSYDISLLGADYGKIPLPRTFKLGVNLKL
ncbi:SusC/RagA family TonB-linked outer membrane protein [Sphingobacterium spiritivorum]|nr:SusC/RagA family TonB-linked outer membrane protein [Sphingobacterium spiritivorum]